MTGRRGIPIALACLLTVGAGATIAAESGGETDMDWTRNPERWVDERFVFEPGDGVALRRLAVRSAADSSSAPPTLRERRAWGLGEAAWERYPATGVWRSGPVEVDGGFTELLPSWNVQAPAWTGLVMQVRVRWDPRAGADAAESNDGGVDIEKDDDGDGGGVGAAAWSPWREIGAWGEPTGGDTPTAFDGGRVAVDVLELDRRASAFEVRVWMESRDMVGRASPRLRRVAAVASRRDDPLADTGSDEAVAGEPIVIDVPHMVDGQPPDAVIAELCSPWSTAMVMKWAGVDLPIQSHARAIFDPDHRLFGNWGRAVAWASSHGLDAELTRFRTWDRVRAALAAGQPIIASIAFDEGEFPSNIMDSTNGHLIVLRGLTDAGDAIVNDPASRDRGEAVVYRRDELARAWMSRGGVAYLIRPATD